jgi:GDPmannose 4,6-dehydratase
MNKSALITGITGQDGSYLAEFLLAKGYRVCGLVRRLSTPNTERIAQILDKIDLIPGDMLDQPSLMHAIKIAAPDEVYNLAAQSHVGVSFTQPTATAQYTGVGCLRLLEAIRHSERVIRFYQAGSSEMFGDTMGITPQTEQTSFHPRSPYGCAKLYAHWTTANYRASYGMFACNGILFNHESPRRGSDFVTRKISQAVANIATGGYEALSLGNLNACRDWGFAGDYVQAMWLMLQQETPQDYVIATGETHSVREFVDAAFRHIGVTDWHKYVQIDPNLYRPLDIDVLTGDASKALKQLKWAPTVTFEQLVSMMVDADIDQLLSSERQNSETQSLAYPFVGGDHLGGVVGLEEVR